jgi:hypothetical protein
LFVCAFLLPLWFFFFWGGGGGDMHPKPLCKAGEDRRGGGLSSSI